MLQTILLASRLQGARHLLGTLEDSIKFTFHESIAGPIVKQLRTPGTVPSPATVNRYLLTLDAAIMKVDQDRYSLQLPRATAEYCLMDSSPLLGVD
eukprot:4395110-Pyramimonas_sp.AAC.1